MEDMTETINNFIDLVKHNLIDSESSPCAANSGAMTQTILDRIEERLRVVGLSAAAAGRAAGMSSGTIRNIQQRPGGGVSIITLQKLAGPLQTTAAYLLTGETNADASISDGVSEISHVKIVPVVGTVRAGAFVSVPEYAEPEEFVPFSDPQYERASLFALRVYGRSMNEFYPDGSIVICVPAAEAGVLEGDHVVLQRGDKAGRIETTLKEVVMNGAQFEFWPRSDDANHQTPFIPPPQNDHTDEVWQVTGVVIWSQRKRPPRGGRMITLP